MGEGIDISTLLRLAADGELTSGQAERLEHHLAAHPEDRGRVAFERALREACGTHLGARAPAGLRERIAAALREQDAEAPAIAGRVAPDGPAPDEPVVVRRARRVSWSQRVLNIAAVLVVAGLAVFFLKATLTSDTTTALAGFLPKEHNNCAVDPDRLLQRDNAVTNLAEVPSAYRALLGASPTIPDIEALGYRFAGAGPCSVPAGGQSVHLMFEAVKERRPKDCPNSPLSLFIQRTDRFDVEPGQTYSVNTPDDEFTIYAWTADGLVYYLVADSRGQCNEVMEALPLRTPAIRLRPANKG